MNTRLTPADGSTPGLNVGWQHRPAPTALAVLLVFTLHAGAQGATAAASDVAAASTPVASAANARVSDSKLARADATFLKDAAAGGIAEVEASKLAAEKAVDPRVKSFAQQMVADHTKANEQLTALAAAKGVKLPTEPSLMQKAKLKMLSMGDGSNFDKRYADSFGVKAHNDTVKLFEKAANSAKDAEVKGFASSTLPTLKHHLEMARSIMVVADSKSAAAANPGARP